MGLVSCLGCHDCVHFILLVGQRGRSGRGERIIRRGRRTMQGNNQVTAIVVEPVANAAGPEPESKEAEKANAGGQGNGAENFDESGCGILKEILQENGAITESSAGKESQNEHQPKGGTDAAFIAFDLLDLRLNGEQFLARFSADQLFEEPGLFFALTHTSSLRLLIRKPALGVPVTEKMGLENAIFAVMGRPGPRFM